MILLFRFVCVSCVFPGFVFLNFLQFLFLCLFFIFFWQKFPGFSFNLFIIWFFCFLNIFSFGIITTFCPYCLIHWFLSCVLYFQFFYVFVFSAFDLHYILTWFAYFFSILFLLLCFFCFFVIFIWFSLPLFLLFF